MRRDTTRRAEDLKVDGVNSGNWGYAIGAASVASIYETLGHFVASIIYPKGTLNDIVEHGKRSYEFGCETGNIRLGIGKFFGLNGLVEAWWGIDIETGDILSPVERDQRFTQGILGALAIAEIIGNPLNFAIRKRLIPSGPKLGEIFPRRSPHGLDPVKSSAQVCQVP